MVKFIIFIHIFILFNQILFLLTVGCTMQGMLDGFLYGKH